MIFQSSILFPRILGLFVLVLLLLLVTMVLLGYVHGGELPVYVQSTEAILE